LLIWKKDWPPHICIRLPLAVNPKEEAALENKAAPLEKY
jgi:hypothetical protein